MRLRGTPWTSEFMAEYEAAKGAVPSTTRKGITAGTWRWLCIRYFAECTDYKLLDEKTQRIRRWILEATYDEPIAPDSPKLFRDFPLSRMTTEAIEVLRDRKIATPEAANHRLKSARAVFLWAVRKRGADGRPYAPHNPARDVHYLKTGSTGYHSWTAEEVQQFEARHPIGTKARLALALLLLTGQRRSDVIRFGRQHIQDGRLSFTQFKGRNRKPKRLSLPILPALQRVIDASSCGDLTFLVNDRGHPFPDKSFGNKFRAWCDEAGLHHCSAHGLRKAGATIAAEAGATAHQLMAMFGWTTIGMAQRYTQAADQKRLADGSMHLIEAPERTRTEACPTEPACGTSS